MHVHRFPISFLCVMQLVSFAVTAASAFAAVHSSDGSASQRNILVTGAGGKTGRIVLKKLLERKAFDPIGLVRTESSKRSLIENGVPESKIIVADICDASTTEDCFSGVDAIIICTSATPAPTGEKVNERPVFGYPNGEPKEVDWLGQKNQIDAAKKYGVSHVVLCSSMGGTNPENMLNTLGRSEDDPAKGNILLWKRKAEKYLIESGLTYTIIHPGGLIDDAGSCREIVVGVDDEQVGTDSRVIPRTDVAELLVSSLEYDSYRNRSFDARTKPEGEGGITRDYDQLLKDLNNNCDYTLGSVAE